MRTFAIVSLALLAGCKKPVSTTTDAAPAVTSPAEPTAATPPPDAVDAAAPAAKLVLPGPCVDPVADAQKREPSGTNAIDEIDLDEDGTKDKIIGRIDETKVPNYARLAYVMRGKCGHYVGSLTGMKVKPSGNRSKGLRSVDVSSVDGQCVAQCGCSDRVVSYFFNGTAYTRGKVTEATATPCKDAGAPKRAPAAGAFKAGDKLTLTNQRGVAFPVTAVKTVDADTTRVKFDDDKHEEDVLDAFLTKR